MKRKIKNILDIVGNVSKCELCYILHVNSKKAPATIGLKNKNSGIVPFNQFNKDLQSLIKSGELNYSEISKLASYKDIIKNNSFGSFYYKPLYELKDEKYFLILFSKNDMISDIKAEPNLGIIENYLSDYISESMGGEGLSGTEMLDIFQKLDVGLLLCDPKKSSVITANYKCLKIFRLESAVDIKLSEIKVEFTFPDNKNDPTINKEMPFPEIIKSGRNIVDQSIRLTFKNKIKKNVIFNCFQIQDNRGQIKETVCTFNETSRARTIKDYLKEASRNIDAVIYSATPWGNEYFFITEAIQKILGYTEDEISRSAIFMLRRISPEDLPKFKQFVLKLQQGYTAQVEYTIKDKENNMHVLRHAGFPVFEDDALTRIDGVIYDITEEKRVQTALEKSEERFRLLIETAQDIIFNLNPYGYFVTVNGNGALSLGYRRDQMIGKHFLDFIEESSKEEIALAFKNILSSNKPASFDAAFIDKFGNNVVFEIQARSIKTDGEISGMLGIARNITQRRTDEIKLKELNAKLIEANRLVSIERDRARYEISILEELNMLKNEFVSNISHELRTPLASIIGFAETINSDSEMPKDMVKEFSEIILSEGKRLARLINDVLDLSRIESGTMTIVKSKFNVVELLQTIIDSYEDSARKKGITISREIPENEIYLQADKERIDQVYSHLLANAIKFTNSGGRVAIIARNFLKEFEVIVSDTGIGISDKEMQYLFKKFYKGNHPGNHQPGTGLGLVLVKQIVDLHKGMITVKSEMNRGATFIVKLPKSLDK